MKIWVNINAMIPAIPVAVQLVRLFKNCSGVPLKSPGILNLSSLFLSQAPRMESDRQPANPEIPAIRIIPPGLSAEPARIDRPMRKEPASAAASPLLLRSEEHTSELQSRGHLVCRLLLEKKKSNRKLKATRETDTNIMTRRLNHTA